MKSICVCGHSMDRHSAAGCHATNFLGVCKCVRQPGEQAPCPDCATKDTEINRLRGIIAMQSGLDSGSPEAEARDEFAALGFAAVKRSIEAKDALLKKRRAEIVRRDALLSRAETAIRAYAFMYGGSQIVDRLLADLKEWA